MVRVVLRLWLPDRPGALGAVAGRIGAVRGDLVGIDILERGGGRAIDELVVLLPDEELIGLLVREVNEVDGVCVEEARPAVGGERDARLDALETAALLVEADDVDELLDALVIHAAHDFEAAWGTIVEPGGADACEPVGSPPPGPWLGAFVAGGRSSAMVAAGQAGPDDVAWAPLAVADLALVLGRSGRPFRSRERAQLGALSRIADRRWVDLQAVAARRAHPSAS